jgi:cytochrome P450
MSPPHQLLLSLLVILLLSFLHKLYKWQTRLKTFRKTMPALPVLFSPFSPYRRLFPKRFQTFHFDWSLQYRHKIYEALESDIFVLVSLFDYDEIQVCDPHLFMEIKSQWEKFPKDVERMKAVAIYGSNVITAEGREWRKHRKITARAFSPRTVQIVLAETVRQTNEMLNCLQRKYTDNQIEMEEYDSPFSPLRR